MNGSNALKNTEVDITESKQRSIVNVIAGGILQNKNNTLGLSNTIIWQQIK